MDGIFGAQNYRNEIIWKRRYGTFSTVHTSNKFGNSTDTILFYAKSDENVFKPQYSFDDPTYQSYLEKAFRFFDEKGRRYRIDNLANPALRPNLIYEYKGYKPPANGWAISREKMELWDKEGRLHFPKSPEGRIQRKRFFDEVKGKATAKAQIAAWTECCISTITFRGAYAPRVSRRTPRPPHPKRLSEALNQAREGACAPRKTQKPFAKKSSCKSKAAACSAMTFPRCSAT